MKRSTRQPRQRSVKAPPSYLDTRGDITVRVARVMRHTDEVSSYLLHRSGGLPLPPCEAGAHLDVYLPDGLVRSYSLCGDPLRIGKPRNQSAALTLDI